MSTSAKEELRSKYKVIRRHIPERESKNKLIAANLSHSVIWQNAQIIALYLSFGSEVETDAIVQLAIEQNKTVAVPVTDNESYAIDFYRYDLNEETTDSKLGMAEPVRDPKKLISPEMIDLCILPGLAFDRFGHRLGMGKGCYDRYLPHLRPDAVKAALCFSEQISESPLPHDKFDIDLDWLISDRGIYKCEKISSRSCD